MIVCSGQELGASSPHWESHQQLVEVNGWAINHTKQFGFVCCCCTRTSLSSNTNINITLMCHVSGESLSDFRFILEFSLDIFPNYAYCQFMKDAEQIKSSRKITEKNIIITSMSGCINNHVGTLSPLTRTRPQIWLSASQKMWIKGE